METEIERIARECQDAFGPLDREEGRIALGVFRELATGRPTTAEAVADRAGAAPARVLELLDSWAGVFRDDEDRVVGFWGLALPEMPHRIVISGRTLHGWCAWDCLFLPQLLGAEARITSRCPATQTVVSLTVTADGIRKLQPRHAVLSFVEPKRLEAEKERVLTSFCHHVHFFASPEAWADWASEWPVPSSSLTVQEGWRLGRLVNRLRYGDLWDAESG